MPATITTEVVQILAPRLVESGTWILTVDELETLSDPVDLYRAVYELKLIGRDFYGPETSGELVTLLERLDGPDAENTLRTAGLFLNHDDHLDLTERFVRGLRVMTTLHIPEPETFRAMIRQFRRYEEALASYCETHLDTSRVIDETARPFSERFSGTGAGPAPGLAGAAAAGAEVTPRLCARLTGEWYLLSLLERNVVRIEDLAPALFELLRAVARQEGALPPLGAGAADAAGEDAGAQDAEQSRMQTARRTLRLTGSTHSRSEIRRAYRQLMRKFHPDINPDGLEMAKTINSAYAILLTTAGPD